MSSTSIRLPQKASAPDSSPASTRLQWIDQARAYGMFLVYYGHFVEQLAKLGNQAAALQYKFIYSFHMPLFFVLSGYVYRDKQESFPHILKRLARTRLVPALFFNVLAFIVIATDDFISGNFSIDLIANGVRTMLIGHPSFNWITWFLVCLFTVELINYGMQKHVQTVRQKIFAIVLFLVGAEYLHGQFGSLLPGTGITNNIWFIDEALFAYPFFLIGMLLKQTHLLQPSRLRIKKWGIVLASTLFVLLTFNLNPHGFFNPFILDPQSPDFAVRMAHSIHGNILGFVATAIAGSLLIFFFAQLLPTRNFVLFIGRNTLILLGLNHFFFVTFGRVAPLLNPFLSMHGVILAFCTLLTALSMVLCVPCILILNRHLPQWVGRRRALKKG